MKYLLNAGDFRHKIAIETLTTIMNENGFKTEEWIDFIVTKACVKNLIGREYYAAASVKAENTKKFIIRYSKALDPGISEDGIRLTKILRIKFNNLIFNINSIENIKYENKYLEIKAMEEL